MARVKNMSGHRQVHSKAAHNRTEIGSSSICGCFHCCKSFAAKDVVTWIKERKGGDDTAMCPHCGIDSVIGDASGYPVTDDEFLHQMKAYWFSVEE